MSLEARVLGILADLDRAAPALAAEVRAAEERAGQVDERITKLLDQIGAHDRSLRQNVQAMGKASHAIAEGNMQIAGLHQDIATLERRAGDIRAEAERIQDDPSLRRRIRREAARLSVQVEDRQGEVEVLRREVEAKRAELTSLDSDKARLSDGRRQLLSGLDQVQDQLPKPGLYARLFESAIGRCHAVFVLEGDRDAWQRGVAEAVAIALQLHRDLRLGKYRLDKNSELIGGRSMTTAEGLYGAVAIGRPELCQQLFDLATDPALYFHQIFNVFRSWLIGLWVHQRWPELDDLLARHRYSEGLRGAYVAAFSALRRRDEKGFRAGVRDMVRHEQQVWRSPAVVQGVGVLNLGALGLCRLGLEAGLKAIPEFPTVPRALTA